MGSRRSRLTILLALVVAAAAAYVAYAAVGGSDDEPAAEVAAVAAPTSIPTEGVLVALRDIPAATTLTADMIEVRQVQPDAVSPRALTEPEQAVGLLTAVALTAGEQILDTRLTDQPPAPETFANEVPVGMRAMSLVFTEIQGFGGLVQPGDQVDVVAYFELEVDDLTIEEKPTEDEVEAAKDDADEDDSDEADDSEDEADHDYKQYVTVFVAQNVGVLSVAQALDPEEVGIADRAPEPPATEAETAVEGEAEAEATADEPATAAEPKARPDAKSVSLAVTPEQAQRLLLASQITKEEDVSLRLIVRAPGDTTIYDLPPAQLGEIPLGGLLGDVNVPLTPTELVITGVRFAKRVLNSGEVLEFTATVKNVSDRTVGSGADAPPEYVYTQGVAYDDLGFFAQPGTYRIGLNVSGAYPTPFPYRWGLGRDLAPGESTTIVGSVQLTEPVPDTRYWLGVIQEQNTVTQDGVGVTDVTVLASEAVTVEAPAAELLTAPEPGADLVRLVEEGERLEVLGVRGPWFRVRAGDQEGWIPAPMIVAEPAAVDEAPETTDAAAPPDAGASSASEEGGVDARPVSPVKVTVTAPSAELREAPHPNGAIVADVAAGDSLTVLGVRGTWFRVRAGDQEGWIPTAAIATRPAPGDGADAPAAETAPSAFDWVLDRWVRGRPSAWA